MSTREISEANKARGGLEKPSKGELQLWQAKKIWGQVHTLYTVVMMVVCQTRASKKHAISYCVHCQNGIVTPCICYKFQVVQHITCMESEQIY